MNNERRIGGYKNQDKVKVFLNEQDDYIFIDPNDSGLFDRFAGFVAWVENKGLDMERKGKEIKEKYGDIITTDEDGDVTDFKSGALLQLLQIKTDAYREACDKIDVIFGTDTCHKYFRASYETNPHFVPDDTCILEFLEDITPVVDDIFKERQQRINLKYSKDRSGGKKSRYRQ